MQLPQIIPLVYPLSLRLPSSSPPPRSPVLPSPAAPFASSGSPIFLPPPHLQHRSLHTARPLLQPIHTCFCHPESIIDPMAASSDYQYGVWGNLTPDMFDLITERLDITDAVRLAACSKELCRKVAYTMGRHHWDGPCLLMPDPVHWIHDDNRADDTLYDVVPLDHPRRTAILPFMCGDRCWAGMNGDWIAAVDPSGHWCLANVYTRRQIDLPPLSTCDIWRDRRFGDGHHERYTLKSPCDPNYLHMFLRKMVICNVPTKTGHYKDYKLIALFATGLAYLEGGSQAWRYLGNNLTRPPHYHDAIEHGGIIFAVAGRGLLYSWDPAHNGKFSIHIVSNTFVFLLQRMIHFN